MVKIFIDAGHGGTDSGAIGNGLQEKNVTLQIANRVRDMLQSEYQNVSVKMSRTGDQTLSLKQRTDMANAWGADFFLSIHINSGGGTGYEDYIYDKLSDNSKTAQLRNVIHEEIIKLIGMRNRGKKKANFHVLRESKMDALLTENGFIDNASDAALMKNSMWLDNAARGHVNGLARALGLQKKIGGNPKQSQQEEVTIIYHDQSIQGLLIDSISYVPVREFGELVGATVHWDGKSAYLNNQKIDGKLINHRVYLPVREIAEQLSLKVSWNDKTNTVTVSK